MRWFKFDADLELRPEFRKLSRLLGTDRAYRVYAQFLSFLARTGDEGESLEAFDPEEQDAISSSLLIDGKLPNYSEICTLAAQRTRQKRYEERMADVRLTSEPRQADVRLTSGARQADVTEEKRGEEKRGEKIETTVSLSDSGEPDEVAEGRRRGNPPKPKIPIEQVDAFVAVWNANCGSLARVLEWGEKRIKKIRARINDEPDLDRWAEAVQRVAASSFCRGEQPRLDGKKPWVATFDWLIDNDNNRIKVIEGKYDDKTQVRRSSGPTIRTDWGDYPEKLRPAGTGDGTR